MPDMTNEELRVLIERKRASLEEVRGELRDVQGEARLPADQHMNKINDEIEALRRHPRRTLETMQPENIGLLSAAKRAWERMFGVPRAHDHTHPEPPSDRRHQI